MSTPEKIGDAFDIVIDVAANVLYLAGIAIIELVLRPLFGTAGVPPLAHWILTLGDLVLILTLIRRLVVALDGLLKTLAQTWTITSLFELVQQLKQRPAHEIPSSRSHDAPLQVSPSPESEQKSVKAKVKLARSEPDRRRGANTTSKQSSSQQPTAVSSPDENMEPPNS